MQTHSHYQREPIFKSLAMEKHLRHFIETKSSNKTDPTLLTCASSFPSSTCTIVTVHNVGVNTSYMGTQNTFHASLFRVCLPLLRQLSLTHMKASMLLSSFYRGRTYKRIFSQRVFSFRISCTKVY